jgi:MFS family permease
VLSRAFLRLMATTVLSFGSFTLLLPVVPLQVSALGGGSVAAGACTAVFMATTVTTQLRTPRLLRTRGHRWVLVVGCVLLGAPAVVLPLVGSVVGVLGVTAVRGCGFGLLTVAAGALVAELVAPPRLGRASSVYGVAVGLPQLVTLPVGLAVVAAHGTTPVLLVGGALGLGAAGLAVTLPALAPGVTPPPSAASRLGVRTLLVPVAAQAVVALSFGATLTFLPLAAPDRPGAVGLALAVLTAAMLTGRGLAGPLGDHAGRPGRVLPVGVLVASAGAGLVALGVAGSGPPLLVVGAALFGAGFGVVQNDSLVLLFARAGPARRGPASAAWNVAYDAGTGLGAVVLGVVVALAGYPWAFGVTAAVVGLVGVVLVVGRTRGGAPGDHVVTGGTGATGGTGRSVQD